MPAIQGAPITSWDVGQLTRWLNDRLERFPPSTFTSIKTDTLIVAKVLQIQDELQFTKDALFHKIGAAGNPAFANSWVASGSPLQVPGYWKDPLGFVHLRGSAKTGTINTTMFTLPPGFRPDADERFAVDSNSAHGRLDVKADGTVVPVSGSNVAFSLSGVTYFAKNTT